MTELKQLAAEALFPEGPRWHEGALWYSDILGQTVHRLVPGGVPETMLSLDDAPSGLGFMPDGSLLIVSMRRRQLLRWQAGALSLHADLSGLPGEFLNDMAVDGDGRAYVGARSTKVSPDVFHAAPGGPDSVLVVEPDGSTSVGLSNMCSPNGTVISPDGRSLIIAETYARRLTRFDRDPAGRLSNPSLFAQFDNTLADGICLDEENAVWVSSPYSSEIVRVFEGGRIAERIALTGAVACMLGGEDRRTLFILAVDPGHLPNATASSSGHAPAAGSIFCVQVANAGVGWP